jgi:hypothetical protein
VERDDTAFGDGDLLGIVFVGQILNVHENLLRTFSQLEKTILQMTPC